MIIARQNPDYFRLLTPSPTLNSQNYNGKVSLGSENSIAWRCMSITTSFIKQSSYLPALVDLSTFAIMPGYDSYKAYFSDVSPLQQSHTWQDIRGGAPSAGQLDIEETGAKKIALQALREGGFHVDGLQVRFFHVREFSFPSKPLETAEEMSKLEQAKDTNQANEFLIKSSKLFVVLVGEQHVVTIHNEASPAIEAVKALASKGSKIEIQDIPIEIIRNSLTPLEQITTDIRRIISPMAEGASVAGLGPEDHFLLNRVEGGLNHIIGRLDESKAEVTTLESHSNPPNGVVKNQRRQSLLAEIDSRRVALQGVITTAKDAKSNYQSHTETKRAEAENRQAEELAESNRLKEAAEARKRRDEARWQILGGTAVPIGLGLAAIDAFNIATEPGLGLLGVSMTISALLLFFRNERVLWNRKRPDNFK